MKQWYKMAGLLVLVACAVEQVNGQTHFGVGAGTQGSGHAFFGTDAGKVNTASNNSFFGHESGLKNTTGSNNAFFGYRSGNSNLTGVANTFVGTSAGAANTSGVNNVFLGNSAGVSNLTGVNNVYLGSNAGTLNKSGGGNVAIGNEANYGGEGGVGNCSIGYRAGFKNNGTYNVFLGSSAGEQNESGIDNAFLGGRSGYLNSTGSSNAFFGFEAGSNIVGEKNTYLGFKSGGKSGLINATAIGADAKVVTSNSLVLGNNANVGIGVSNPTYQLQLSTDEALKVGSSLWKIPSDSRLKKNISDFTDGLAIVKRIKPVWFTYNGSAGIKSDKQFVGIIAQDMQKIASYTIGQWVYEDTLGTKTEYLDYDANAVTYILINAVKEQQEIIDQKETKIQDLADRLEKVEQALTSARIGSSENKSNVESEESGSILQQNAPNGFSQETSIKYFIPQSVKKAVMNIYSLNGAKVGSYNVNERGEGALKLSASDFSSGVFVYDLVTDGKSNGARKMVVK